MKLVVAMMQHETNTFSPLPTTYAHFGTTLSLPGPAIGDQVVDAFAGTGTALAAFLELARQKGAEIVTPVAAYAEPSGPVDAAAFDRIADMICDAAAEGCDGVLLDLHGAMVTTESDDGEGELLRRLRRVAPAIPVGVALDFHANLSAAMVDGATVISGYRTYPHIDMYETGARCAATLFRVIEEDLETRMVWGALPLLTAMMRQATLDDGPMVAPMTLASAGEAAGDVLLASVFGGFPLADVPHAGLSAVVVAEAGDAAAGESLLRVILERAWASRADFRFTPEPVDKAIAVAAGLNEAPIIVSDHSDNAGAGGPMDDMGVIREMLRQGLTGIAAGPVWDPQALDAMRKVGVGGRVTLAVGGKTDIPALGLSGRPLELTGTVRRLTDGRFRLTGDMMNGFPVDLGGTAVLDTGAMELIVCGERMEVYHPLFLTHAGIDPARKRFVVVKSRQHFKAGFSGVAKHIVPAGCPSACFEDYPAFPFRHLMRPIYPLDPDCTWSWRSRGAVAS